MNSNNYFVFPVFLFFKTKIFSLVVQVECFGPGVQRDGVSKGQRAQFTVDTRRAGSAPLDVQVLDANCNNIDVNVRSNGDGTYNAEYVPKTGSRHTVQVNIFSSLYGFSCNFMHLYLKELTLYMCSVV
jgi:hypothetical protein